MTFNTGKCLLLPLGWNNPMQPGQLRDNYLGSSSLKRPGGQQVQEESEVHPCDEDGQPHTELY